jgi:hypothetical protein
MGTRVRLTTFFLSAIGLAIVYFLVISPSVTYMDYERNGIEEKVRVITVTKFDTVFPYTKGTWVYRVKINHPYETESINFYRAFINLRQYNVGDSVRVMYMPSSPESFIFADKHDKFYGIYFGLPFIIIFIFFIITMYKLGSRYLINSDSD